MVGKFQLSTGSVFHKLNGGYIFIVTLYKGQSSTVEFLWKPIVDQLFLMMVNFLGYIGAVPKKENVLGNLGNMILSGFRFHSPCDF